MQKAAARILFVDDHEDIRFMIKTWLGMFNYEVTTAEGMVGGLQLAQSETFDLYIFDSNLPDGTAQELCEKVHEFNCTTPIIFYSGDTPERLRRAMVYGAQDWVMKPDLDGLRKAIFRALNVMPA